MSQGSLVCLESFTNRFTSLGVWVFWKSQLGRKISRTLWITDHGKAWNLNYKLTIVQKQHSSLSTSSNAWRWFSNRGNSPCLRKQSFLFSLWLYLLLKRLGFQTTEFQNYYNYWRLAGFELSPWGQKSCAMIGWWIDFECKIGWWRDIYCNW